jgi:hypothetical protein
MRDGMNESARRIPDAHIILGIADAGVTRTISDYFEFHHHHHNSDQGFYKVIVATNGDETLKLCEERKYYTLVIVLDIDLTDMTRDEFIGKLSDKLGKECVKFNNFIFLEDREISVEATMPEYIRGLRMLKPLQPERLRCVVRNMTYGSHKSTNPVTHLPSGKLIEEQFEALAIRQDWAILCIEVNGEDFKDMQGYDAKNRLEHFIADLVEETVDEWGAPNDFMGHVGEGDFVVVTHSEKSGALSQALQTRFSRDIQQFYSLEPKQSPLIALSVKVLYGNENAWGNAGEIAKKVSELMHLGEKNQAGLVRLRAMKAAIQSAVAPGGRHVR